ncbi:MAG TPA: phage holin family protein [Methylomirabilota bacterium]|nr:phage holin family protein [Methylomirabilota bacterium]
MGESRAVSSRLLGRWGNAMFILLRLVINAVSLLVAAWIVPGIHLAAAGSHPQRDDWIALGIVALVFGAVNVLIRPLLLLVTLPLNFVTLGLFTYVINAFMLLLTSWIAQGMGVGFRVQGFVAALLGALIVSLVSFVLSRLLEKAW